MGETDDLNDGLDDKRTRIVKLGCHVTSKRTGLPATGKVCGVLTPGLYLGIMHKTVDDHHLWTDMYSDWTQKIIVVVEFDQPQRACSLQEMHVWYPELDGSELLKAYNDVPVAVCAMYPIDDLEVLE